MTDVAFPATIRRPAERRAATAGPALAILAVVAVIAGGVGIADGGTTGHDVRPAGKAAPAAIR